MMGTLWKALAAIITLDATSITVMLVIVVTQTSATDVIKSMEYTTMHATFHIWWIVTLTTVENDILVIQITVNIVIMDMMYITMTAMVEI